VPSDFSTEAAEICLGRPEAKEKLNKFRNVSKKTSCARFQTRFEDGNDKLSKVFSTKSILKLSLKI